MTILTRIYREPAALLALVTAVLAVLTFVGVLDEVGAGVALGVITAAIGALRYLVTPAAEVVVQRKAGDRAATAGPASPIPTGTEVVVRRLRQE